MKRIFTLVMFAVSISLSTMAAIKIQSDDVSSDGTRIVIASFFNIYSETLSGGALSLHATEFNVNNERTRFYSLNFMLNDGVFEIIKGSKLLIKLENGEIIELSAAGDVLKDYDMLRTGLVYPTYLISKDDLQKISITPVVKIRIETAIGTIDHDIKKNKFSKGIKESLVLIDHQLQTVKDIYSDF